MVFNSLDFAVFLPVVFALYWISRKYLKLQNFIIVLASYFFYGYWDWRFLTLIFFSTTVDYFVGLALATSEHQSRRRAILYTSIFVNLGFLGFFKYSNFFVENFVQAFSFFGYQVPSNSLNIILPVGISFYTFQSLAYTIDVYRRQLQPTKDFISFCAFVSFFPQLVAGPIERATHLLPQFSKPRSFDYTIAKDGMKQILWGLAKKMVVADTCAVMANQVFDEPDVYGGSSLVLGAIFFAVQIYADFSGYSDIAVGTAKLFGFSLMRNFNYPYFSKSIPEFWRRWHISLSTWFRDYVYIPLGGSHGGRWLRVRNIMIVFVVSGLWHGARWTFIIWGFLNALYMLPSVLRGQSAKREIKAESKDDSLLPSMRSIAAMVTTFGLTTFGWIWFRAESIGQATHYIRGIFSRSLFGMPAAAMTPILIPVVVLFVVEWFGRSKEYPIKDLNEVMPAPMRWLVYYGLVLAIFLFTGEEQEFIYFQF